MLRIGIECESIEGPESWGIGRIVKKLLEEIANRPELKKEFKFFLYFKSKIPDYPWLANPIFIKKTILKHSNILQNVGMNLFRESFSLYYFIYLPIKLWFEKLDMMFFPNYMLPILFRGKSLVVLTEDIYYEINSGTLPWRYKLAYRIFAGWWTVCHATKIMAISETSKRELTKLFGISTDRIAVNQLGIDKNPKTPSLHSNTIVSGCKQEKKQNDDRASDTASDYILYVGQAFPRRHLRETMLAFEKLTTPNTERLNLVEAQPLSNLKLIAIGKDKYNPPTIGDLVKKINERLGRDAIIWKEYVSEDELAELYANAKCLVYISSREAFGLPPLEALSYGVPAVVADQSITHEIFDNNAFFVTASDPLGSSASKHLEAELPSELISNDNYDVEAIAETIKKALTDKAKRQEIIANASQILQEYTWQGFTNNFLDFARKINQHTRKEQ